MSALNILPAKLDPGLSPLGQFHRSQEHAARRSARPNRLRLALGRVSTGEGGNIVLRHAKAVIERDYPDLAGRIELHLPDEKSRRVGQAVAAASLPKLKAA